MDKQQKKRIRTCISWILLASLVVVLAFLPALAAPDTQPEGPVASIYSDTAQLRSISSRILAGGTLTGEDPVEITIPEAVKLTAYHVRNGDMVKQGDPVASVDRISVMSAISEVQETLTLLAEEIESAGKESVPDEITATAGGIVKIIYAREGESVQDVMLRDGALAALSLDGLMAVQLERRTNLAGGDGVCLTFSDGTETQGRVESNIDGILTVTLRDAGYSVGEEVHVATSDGDRIGTGTLYIHSQWNAVGYSGTVSRVRVREGDTVSAGKTLFSLRDTGFSPSFASLLRQRQEYEALMLTLFRMYQSESITAPQDGIVSGVDDTGAHMLSDTGAGWEISLLVNAPTGEDEKSYVNYIGQVAEVGIDGLILQLNPQPLSVTDYKDLSGVPRDPSLMTESVIYSGSAPIYELQGDTWIQIGSGAISPGDLLLFACDDSGGFVWVVRVARGATQPDQPEVPPTTEPESPAEPTVPTEPESPTEPSVPEGDNVPTEPSIPDTPVLPSLPGGSGQGGGWTPPAGGYSGWGGTIQEDPNSLYSLETITIASVTAQNTMTLQVTVDEQDISGIYRGQEADITVDALNGRIFAAIVTEISGSGINGGGSSKFTVTLTLDRTEDMLAGMKAHASLTTAVFNDLLCIPVAALFEDGSRTFVYTGYDVETDTWLDPVEVTVGLSDGEYVQILSGLTPEQRICYPYYDTLFISTTPEAGFGMPFR